MEDGRWKILSEAKSTFGGEEEKWFMEDGWWMMWMLFTVLSHTEHSRSVAVPILWSIELWTYEQQNYKWETHHRHYIVDKTYLFNWSADNWYHKNCDNKFYNLLKAQDLLSPAFELRVHPRFSWTLWKS